VDLRLADYRQASGRYDVVLSIGIFEHVGEKNHRGYFELARRCLAPGGVAFVHTIASDTTNHLIDPWYHRYIFPNAQLPSAAQLGAAIEGLFSLEDLHNIGPDYDATLMAWWRNFDAAWPELRRRGGYDERFYRMWRFYLLSSAAAFRARRNHLYQLVLTPAGSPQPPCRLS
jgi:cyclopropane-fatty-acyl-phospholipid synthase